METLVCKTESLCLYERATDRWVIFSFTGDEVPRQEDLIQILESLKRAADEVTRKPIVFAVEVVSRPNSRMLSAVIGLLTDKHGQPRRLALAGASQTWLDMLDILGVRSNFLIVESVEEVTFED